MPTKRQPARPSAVSTASAAAPALPPYGHMHNGLTGAISAQPAPRGFDDGSWNRFRDTLIDEYAQVLWPRWQGDAWVGAAGAGMGALTQADLQLMATLRPKQAQPAGARGDLLHTTHRGLFLAEDDMPASGPYFDTARRYLAGQPPGVIGAALLAMKDTLAALGPRPLQFKQHLQRPRPYQASLLLGSAVLDHDWARSAVTPSMISGHTLQGLVVATGAYIDQALQIDALPDARAQLQQFGVDFGDRRVFAGVHYPTDNLASWVLSLRLAPVFFGADAPAARQFMLEAIARSAVFAALAAALQADPASPFAAPMQWLRAQP